VSTKQSEIEWTTQTVIEAVAWGRGPTYPGTTVTHPIRCADGFTVSVQASPNHYANDSHASGEAAYWRGVAAVPTYPFTTFEVGYPSSDPEPAYVWAEYDCGGVWAWVPRQIVADLLDAHGGAVAWQEKTHD